MKKADSPSPSLLSTKTVFPDISMLCTVQLDFLSRTPLRSSECHKSKCIINIIVGH